MPDFKDRDWIVLQPYDETTYEFEVTVCSAAGANDGHLAYGDGISSVTVLAHSEDGTDKTSELVVSDSETANIITVKLQYPATTGPGIYHLEFNVDTDNGDKKELDFNRIRAKDL